MRSALMMHISSIISEIELILLPVFIRLFPPYIKLITLSFNISFKYIIININHKQLQNIYPDIRHGHKNTSRNPICINTTAKA